MMTRHLRLLSLALLGAVLVGAAVMRGQAGRTGIRLRMLDSAKAPSWNVMDDDSGIQVYRFEVRGRGTVAVIDSVIAPFPIGVGDSMVVGLRLATRRSADGMTAERRLFRLRLPKRRLETWPAPADTWVFAFDLIPSPDGKYVAYAGSDSLGADVHGVVRELASGALVLRGPDGGECECDVDMNHVRWFAQDSFEIAIVHTVGDADKWQRISGRASARRFRVDTLAEPPKWH